MPVFVCDFHFLYDLFNVLIHDFDITIHLWPVTGRIVMLNLELLTQCSDHSVVDICTIVSDDPFWDTIPANEIFLDETGSNILGNGGEGGCFNPLCK